MILEFNNCRKKPIVIKATVITQPMDVETLEGTMHGSVGDYLIIGIQGEKYFCNPDIFKMTYEKVLR